MNIKIFFSFILYFLQNGCYGANILAIIPFASFSHQVLFRPLWRELLQRGHNLTLVTTDPMKDPRLKNLTEIDISYAYKSFEKFKFVEIVSDDSKSFYEMSIPLRQAEKEYNNIFFQSPEGQNLIHNKENHFDLLIVEAQLPAMMVFSWWYQVPFIGVSSLDSAAYFHDALGNPTHPVVNPDYNVPVEKTDEMTFWERLASFIYVNSFKWVVYLISFPKDRNILKNYFGDNVPPLREIQNNISMLFMATHPIFNGVRALMPNTITIGNGMHLNPSKSLPQDLKTATDKFAETSSDIKQFLDSANEGAIYFSLGSNIKGRNLNESTKAELIKAFSSLPYKVLWKIDEKLTNLPENILLSEWCSQQDVLDHPNVKVFITQGGLQSMQESVYLNKPMIGIPFFADQYPNVRRMIHLGFGISVNKHNITNESIHEAVLEIMGNPKYTQKAQEYGEILRDVDIPDVKKAAWWVEYVIRHKGARHFRNPALDMPFWKFYMLDVFGFILGVIISAFMALRLVLRLLHYIFIRRRNRHEKKE